jgi:hypothetical protein
MPPRTRNRLPTNRTIAKRKINATNGDNSPRGRRRFEGALSHLPLSSTYHHVSVGDRNGLSSVTHGHDLDEFAQPPTGVLQSDAVPRRPLLVAVLDVPPWLERHCRAVHAAAVVGHCDRAGVSVDNDVDNAGTGPDAVVNKLAKARQRSHAGSPVRVQLVRRRRNVDAARVPLTSSCPHGIPPIGFGLVQSRS